MRQVSSPEAVPSTEVFPIAEGRIEHAGLQPELPPVRVVKSREKVNVRETSRQETRKKRFLQVCLACVVYLLAIGVFYSQDMVDQVTMTAAIVLALCAMATFCGVFYSGLNQKASEKNLTTPIILSAMAMMLWIAYAAPATRIVFAPFAFVVIAFGVYRLSQKTMLLLSSVALVGYVGVIGLHYAQLSDLSLLKLELLHWFVLALTLPGFVLLTGRVQRLHSALLKASTKIKDIEENAQRDALLGCYNRRYIVAVLEEQKRVADETGTDLCLAVIDLDHFKLVNDEVGHLAGDDVLRTFARIAQENVRQGDVFGRYGGEEFLLVLPETSLLAALNSAERIREQVESYAWSEKLKRSITVSIGLTQYIPGESGLDLFSRTDTAMYMAKRGGRNQVVVEEPTVQFWQTSGC